MSKLKNDSINRQTIKLYWRQIRQHKTSFFLAAICIPLSDVMLEVLLPLFLSQSVSQAVQSSDLSQVTIILAIASGLLGAAMNFVGFRALTFHEATTQKELIENTYQSLVAKDINFFINTKLGALTSRFTDFVNSEVTLRDLLVMETIGFILSFAVGITILTTQMWQLALLFLVLIVFLILEVRWSINKRKDWRKARRKTRSRMYGDLADSLTNSIAVKTFAGEKSEFKNLQKHTTKYRQQYLKDIGFVSAEGSARVFIMTAIQIIIVGYLVYLLSHGRLQLSIAIFVLAYLQRISSQIFTIGHIMQNFDNALLDASPMTEILLSADQIKDKKRARKIKVTDGLIEFDNLSYAYDGKKELAIDGINLIIKPGQKIGLVGKSGSGKTTLVNLLLRFFDPTVGEIRVDGQNIADIKQGSLRKQIAFVPQEPLLFHRSLRENIAYGRPNASERAIISAAKRANAWEFIKKLPDGLDTLVGERGIKLSGGQRQRIAIARAILKDAPILLLDEATSALDSESEKLIQDSLEHLMHQRTSIVIAHRLSTIAKLDRIIVLKDGKVIEDSTHRQLIKNGKTYARLWKHQSGGFIDTID